MVRELNVSRSTILYKLYALCLMMIRYVWNDTTTRTINININIILYTQSSLNYIKCISLFIIVGNFDVSTNGNPARWCGKTLAERKERKKKRTGDFFLLLLQFFLSKKLTRRSVRSLDFTNSIEDSFFGPLRSNRSQRVVQYA